jgi:hypothetical protein
LRPCRESLAIETPQALFPFLHHLATNPPAPINYLTTQDQLKLSDPSITVPGGIAPLDWSSLSPSQVYETLHATLNATALLTPAERASLDLSLAAREGSVAIESFRQLEITRRAVVQLSPLVEDGVECENWVEVGGRQACTVDEVWARVGADQRDAAGPLTVTSV